MTVDLTSAEFRQLLDMVYIGNWVLNSARGDDRITEYDRIESKIFRPVQRYAAVRACGKAARHLIPVAGL